MAFVLNKTTNGTNIFVIKTRYENRISGFTFLFVLLVVLLVGWWFCNFPTDFTD